MHKSEVRPLIGAVLDFERIAMYGCSMATVRVPLAIPPKLLEEVRATARDTGPSQADIMRQSMRAGLPKVRERYKVPLNLSPVPEKAVASAYRQMSEAEIADDAEMGKASAKAQRS